MSITRKALGAAILFIFILFSCEKDASAVPEPEMAGAVQAEEEVLETPEAVMNETLVTEVQTFELESETLVEDVQALVDEITDEEEIAEVITQLEDALEEDPTNVQILFTLSQFYQRAGAAEKEYEVIQRIQEEEAKGVTIPTTLQFLYGRADQIRADLSSGLSLAELMQGIEDSIKERDWVSATRLLEDGEGILKEDWRVEKTELVRLGIIEDTGVRIESVPSGARVLQNGVEKGTTPLEITGFEARDVSFILTLQEYKDKSLSLSLTPGKVITQETVLIKDIPLTEVALDQGMTFQMGSESGGSNEKPVHQVTLAPFYISATEITQLAWEMAMGEKSPSLNQGSDLPVENVSWYEAVEFCNALSKAKDLQPAYTIGEDGSVECDFNAAGYRLPTEAEWEFAARYAAITSGTSTVYPGGDNAAEVAWYKENSGGTTHPVGQKSPSSGLYDLSGNVWEWCWNSYSSYSDEAQENPRGETSHSGDASGTRVVRGGDWDSAESYLRASARFLNSPAMKSGNLGFRVVRKK